MFTKKGLPTLIVTVSFMLMCPLMWAGDCSGPSDCSSIPDNGTKAASSFQNDSRLCSPRQPDHQAGHERISRADRILDNHLWRRSGNEVAPIP